MKNMSHRERQKQMMIEKKTNERLKQDQQRHQRHKEAKRLRKCLIKDRDSKQRNLVPTNSYTN